MGRAYSTHGEDLKYLNYFSIKSRKIKSGRRKHRLEDVRIDLKERSEFFKMASS